MAVTLQLEETSSALRLEGAIDIRTAAELKQALVEALDAGKPISISFEKVVEADVTAVQLLWAARRQALEAKIEFVYVGAEPEEITDALAEAGLELFATSQQSR
jgi:anti-anti-sigma factor